MNHNIITTEIVQLLLIMCSFGRCEEYEGELTSAREDLIDVMDGDGWVVKLVDSPVIERFYVGKTEQPLVIMFRNNLPVIYNGKNGCLNQIDRREAVSRSDYDY